ncbi:unnamed protein product [Peronospora belbahrii]|uniref:Uncharacterized protein n=1 Tax=Peronospora belbahrii TaxID=622444 RepID=A0AAU9KNI2_9STRA|nr:unnamed protein product [Peronospora belbahrii]
MTSCPVSKSRPVLSTTRRSNQGGVAMSLELRPPRELLAKIGLSGKEVVKIIKARGWEIVEPHGLQQQNLYYIPGVNDNKTTQMKQNETFFVGEGELYAFILQKGGLRYLLPDEELSDLEPSIQSDVEPTQSDERYGETIQDDHESDDHETTDDQLLGNSSSDRRKWKRRKRLSTARKRSTEVVETTIVDRLPSPPLKRRRRGFAKQSVKMSEDKEMNQDWKEVQVRPRAKFEHVSYTGIEQEKEFTMYQKSLKARGWRAQLLQDIDVHLLRSTADVDRLQRARKMLTDGKRKSTRPSDEDDSGPHVVDAAEIRHEIEALMNSIRVSQGDLSSMIEMIISNGEQRTLPDRIDVVGRIGISRFVSTGQGSLILIRDIERYMLLFVAAVRRYQRSREAVCASERASGPCVRSIRAVKREELRALQLGIEDSKKELYELAAIVAADFTKFEDAPEDSIREDTDLSICQRTYQISSQGSSPSSSKITDSDVNVDPGEDRSSNHQGLVSPRLEGGQWFV